MWDTTERIMVAITGAPGTDAVIRRAAGITARMKGDLHAVHVVRTRPVPPSSDGDALQAWRRLADDLGAQWHEISRDDPARALVDFATRASGDPDRVGIEPPQSLGGDDQGFGRPTGLALRFGQRRRCPRDHPARRGMDGTQGSAPS